MADCRSFFIDGPWKGQSAVTTKYMPEWVVVRAGNGKEGTKDTKFVYGPAGEQRNESGVMVQDYQLTYDGPLYDR